MYDEGVVVLTRVTVRVRLGRDVFDDGHVEILRIEVVVVLCRVVFDLLVLEVLLFLTFLFFNIFSIKVAILVCKKLGV